MPAKNGDFFGRDRVDQTISDLYENDKEIRELHPGPRQCLKCDRWFYSWDTTLNRRCEKCKKDDGMELILLDDLTMEDQLDTTLLDKDDE